MKKIAFLCFLCVLATSAQADSATVTCDRQSPGECKVSWLFPAQQAAFSVEQFDVGTQQWKRVYGPVSQASGTTPAAVVEGFLYRAVACESTCTSSTTLWAPVHFPSADEIPETVPSAHGHIFRVSKTPDASFESQRQQYNAYRLYDLYESIKDWAAMPPMTQPPKDPLSSSEEWVHDDLIHAVAYTHYGPVNNDPAIR
jgi:hypothetical protein